MCKTVVCAVTVVHLLVVILLFLYYCGDLTADAADATLSRPRLVTTAGLRTGTDANTRIESTFCPHLGVHTFVATSVTLFLLSENEN